METTKNLSAENYCALGELFRIEPNNTTACSSLLSQHAGNLLSLLMRIDKLPLGTLSALTRAALHYASTSSDGDKEQIIFALNKLIGMLEGFIGNGVELDAWMTVLRKLEVEPAL
jgi:hypothetical protein